MPKITPEQLKALNTTFNASFQKGLDIEETQYGEIATTIRSSSESNTYGWLGAFPVMKEWVGERQVEQLSTAGYQIINKKFETTVGVSRTTIEDDTYGIYAPMMEHLGREAKVFPDSLIFGLLANGITEKCYDDKPFFATDHPVGKTTASNYETDTGEAWYLLDCSKALKPLIYQEREAMELVAMTKIDDEAVFMTDEYRYGVRMRCNVGFGFWQTAYCSKKTLNAENFEKAYSTMRSYLSDNGHPLRIKATHLVVPPTLESTATALIGQTLANGASNPNYNKVKILVCPWLVDNTAVVSSLGRSKK